MTSGYLIHLDTVATQTFAEQISKTALDQYHEFDMAAVVWTSVEGERKWARVDREADS